MEEVAGKKIFRVLLIDDNPDDIMMIKRMLVKNGAFECHSEVTLSAAKKLIIAQEPMEFDIVLLDLSLPDSHGMETFERFIAVSDVIPVIVLTGLYDEQMGIRALKMGAQDYLIKDEVNIRILRKSIHYALERAKLLNQLKAAKMEIHKLQELLPICCVCKKIRNDNGYWEQLENFLSDHSIAEFTHGICPDCSDEIYTDSLENRDEE